jgi:TIR domain
MGFESEVPLAVAHPESEFERAGLEVEKFVRRFGNHSYRELAYHAALPLILTPELVNYLRNAFLRALDPPLPWIADADLLLSELCYEVGYEQYAMKPPIRNYLIAKMREKRGPKRMQDVARLLLRYIQDLKHTKSDIEQRELHTQELAAIAYLDDKGAAAARELAQLFRQYSALGSGNESRLKQLANLTQTLAPQLSAYPQLVRYAEECLGSMLPEGSASASRESIRVEDIELTPNRPHKRRAVKFDAFISYSHAVDGKLASALQRNLHLFDKPIFKLRAIRVFRDETTLAMTPSLWPEIEKALRSSRFFILMADPHSAQSAWVQKEVACWLATRRAENMIIVWTGGNLAWNTATKDFDWERTTALPKLLAGAFGGEEPLYQDLRWARNETHLSGRDPRFATAVASLSAAIRGRSLDEIFASDTRRWSALWRR